MNRSQARSNVYKALSDFFAYPDERVRSSIMNKRRQNVLRQSLQLLDEEYFTGCFEGLKRASDVGNIKPGGDEMAREYERLLDSFDSYLKDASDASDYMMEVWSFMRDKGRRGKGRCRDFEAGFKMTKRPASDAICHRLKLMGILAGLESEALPGEKIHLEEVQLDFLSKFIVPCISNFCDQVILNTFSNFYRALAILTREFVKFEENYLGVPEELQNR